jgi:hypothetical protein
MSLLLAFKSCLVDGSFDSTRVLARDAVLSAFGGRERNGDVGGMGTVQYDILSTAD